MTTIMVMVMFAALIAATVSASMSTMRSTSADYQSTRVFYIAEAGAEAALAQIELALLDGLIEDSELAAMSAPILDGYTFSEYSILKEGLPLSETISDGPYAGMISLTQNLLITSQVTDPTGTTGSITLGAKAQAIPIFQFAAFFEGDMEDYAGSRKDMLGRVHANGDLFLGGADLHFHNTVTTPGRLHRDHKISHADPSDAGVWIKDGSGTDVKLTFDTDDTPDFEQFKQKSENDFDSQLKTEAYGVQPLTLPLPPGMDAHEIIRPKELDDSPSEKETKFAWKADMYVVVDLDNLVDKDDTCDGGGNDAHPTITVTRPYGGAAPDDDDKCDIFDWEFEAFYEHSELLWVDVLNVDVRELRHWMDDDAANESRIIYIEFILPVGCMPDPWDTNPNDGACGPVWPALRARDGYKLPGPLTFGSEYPLYVWGDYNDESWKPAALFGDRLAALSKNWKDSRTYAKPSAQDTEQYFAVVTGTGEGYVGCYHEDAGCTPPPAGGTGWVKLLENWNACGGRCTHTLHGSFVSLWGPKIASAVGIVPGPSYYARPIRDWSFDPRFENPNNLPPGTPVVGQVFRASFRETF